MLPKKKNLTTELKDLDVDRVDGVDRPATGRAFALYKSAAKPAVTKIIEDTPTDPRRATIDRRAKIEKALDTIAQTNAGLPSLIKRAIDRHVMKAVDGTGNTVGYFVQGTDMQSPLYKTVAEAAALVERIVRGEIAKANKQTAESVKPFVRPEDETDRPVPHREEGDTMSTFLNAGNSTSVRDNSVNADPRLGEMFDDDDEWPQGPMTVRRAKHRHAMKRARLNKTTQR